MKSKRVDSPRRYSPRKNSMRQKKTRNNLLLALGLAAIALLLGLAFVLYGAASNGAPDNARLRTGIVGMGDWSPEDFVMHMDGIAAASFDRPIDLNKPGRQRVRIRLVDTEGRRSRLTAELWLLRLRSPLQLEIGHAPEPFLPRALFNERGIEGIPMAFMQEPELLASPGEQSLYLLLDGHEYSIAVRMADTIAPRAVTKDIESYQDAQLDPMDFIDEIIDMTQVTARFATAPDMSLFGQAQVVNIELRDEGGNTSNVRARLNIVEDGEPLVIQGLREIHVGLGGTIAYRKGVTVTNSAGQVIENAVLDIDTAQVNISRPGEYEVAYVARTPAGKETRATVRVVVSHATQVEVDALVAPVMRQIIHDGMSSTEKAMAIFDWLRANITYNNTGEKGGLLDTVHKGMSLRRGDCYTFYALAKYMLWQADIESVSMERIQGTRLRHYWLLLDLGDGWHHFDPTPLIYPAPNHGFMMTESEIEGFNPFGWEYQYYNYDPAKLPLGVVIVR